jgi:DNA polymerase-1
MQANGAEMLRMACCLGTEQGIEICAPVHDAVLICAPRRRAMGWLIPQAG